MFLEGNSESGARCTFCVSSEHKNALAQDEVTVAEVLQNIFLVSPGDGTRMYHAARSELTTVNSHLASESELL
jgi:hypothetical protein